MLKKIFKIKNLYKNFSKSQNLDKKVVQSCFVKKIYIIYPKKKIQKNTKWYYTKVLYAF